MNRFLTVLRNECGRYAIYLRAIGKWLVVSVVAGVLCGLLGSAFHIGVDLVTTIRLTHRWLIWLLPAAGAAIVAIYSLFSVDGQSTNSIISEVQSGNGLKLNLIPAVFFATILTHLCGGSAGREGAALQMGGTIGYETGKLLHLDDRDLRTATLAGMAAFFAAVFGTPIGATIFAIAVISVGLLYHAALLPCLAASLTAYGISLLLHVTPTHFPVSVPAPEFLMLMRVALLSVLCAFVSFLFCTVLHGMEHWMQKRFPNAYLRILVGAAALIVLSLIFPGGEYNGAGSDIIAQAVEQGTVHPFAFLLKLLFTAVTLSAGFKGGEVVPSFFIGSCFGCVIGPLLGIPAGFAAAVGMISVFCGGVNCPIASVFLAIEMFGGEGLIYYAAACVLSYLFSGYTGLYSSQRILYDKLKAQYIDVHTNAYHEGEHTPMEQKYR